MKIRVMYLNASRLAERLAAMTQDDETADATFYIIPGVKYDTLKETRR